MQTIRSGYRGLSLLANLNWDRVLFAGGAAIALYAAAFLVAP
jgi:hypothetical protein